MARRSKRKPDRIAARSPVAGDAGSKLIVEEGRFLTWLQGGVILAVGVWIYFTALSGDWLWDDDKFVTRNPLIHDPAGFWKVWITPDGLGNYDPLTSAVRWLQWQAWGNNPVGYHVTNVGLHLLSALLLWRLLGRLGIREAWLGALVFTVHPLMVESVAWVAELKNTLSLPPLLLAMLALVEYEKNGRRIDYGLALAWFAVSMLAKTAGMMLPVIYLGHAWCRRGKITGVDLKTSLPFFAVMLVAGWATVSARTELGTHLEVVATGGWLARLATLGWTVLFLLGKIFLPVALMPAYASLAAEEPSLADLIPWVLLVGAGALFWRGRARWGLPLLAGFGFFLVNLVPVLGFIAINYATMVWSLDHLVYLPIIGLIGLFAFAVGVMRERISRQLRPLITGVVTLIVVLLAFLARGYAVAFSDEVTLWNYAVECNPNLLLSQENLGKALLLHGRPEEAKPHFEAILKMKPNRAVSHDDLGRALVEMGRWEEGIAEYRLSLRLDPADAEVENNLGVALVQSGKISEAIEHFSTAIRLKPGYAIAYGNLGSAQAQNGQNQAAVESLKRSLELDPASVETRDNLGVALETLGYVPEAIAQFQEALKIDPGDDKAQSHLDRLLRQQSR